MSRQMCRQLNRQMSCPKHLCRICLVTGGSGSGKSAYAEETVIRSGIPHRVYLATMKVFGEEGRKKVERHRKLRCKKGFVTVECPAGLGALVLADADAACDGAAGNYAGEPGSYADAAGNCANIPEEGRAVRERAVLLECMGNLAANELFAEGGETVSVTEREEAAFERIKEGINRIREQCSFLVVVSDEVFSDGVDYGEETNAYIRLLGALNCWLAKEADRVIEVVYGIPVVIKGEQEECFG